ncbi:hypothetical protein AMAG_13449 [Allomyces macrogynus ATCC 38327]|uniref:Uncharacterized protein n=1 Tax=Allomyces macrogynus (strain ATCC 38327) TaxID=578462 RepID=A0A0L0T2J4_ALLM3|nr:hypothetical protein AMAG_13449 [Allomyces macrogynus ATCC 38327]|eukprot:KNE68809.1 hypothetical protein AMAG_13449 [Allomyces macrogynus ATCC 38327]
MKPASGGRSGSAGRPTSARPASARHASVAAASGKSSTGATNLNGSGNSGVSNASKSGSSASATGIGPAHAASGAAATSSDDGHEYDAVALLDTFVTNEFLANISASIPWPSAQATSTTEQASAAGSLSCPPSSPPATSTGKGCDEAPSGAQRLIPGLAHVAPPTLSEAVNGMHLPKEHDLEAKWISKVQLRWPHGDAGTSPPTTSSDLLFATPTTVDLRQLHLIQFHHGNYQWFLECAFSPDQCNVALAIGHVLYTRLLSTVPSSPTIVDTSQAPPPDLKSSVPSVADATKKPKPAAAAAATAPGTSTPAGTGSKAPSTKNAAAPGPTTPATVPSAQITTTPTLPTHPADLARVLDDQLGRLVAFHTVVLGGTPEPQRWRVFEPAHADAVVSYFRRTILSTVRLVQLAHSMVQRAWDEPEDGADGEEPLLSPGRDIALASNVGAMLDQLMIDADTALPVPSVAAV